MGLKNITFSAESTLIERARKKAAQIKIPLNVLFREWLSQIAGDKNHSVNLDALMKKFNYASPGKKFDRDQMNER